MSHESETNTKESSGGLAFEVLLKPAMVSNPQLTCSLSSPCKPDLSHELIERKLKAAEHRRRSVEAARLTYSLKDKQRCSDANQRLQQLNDSFVKDVEKKLVEKMEMTSEKKNMRINSLRDRLKEHAKKVEEVRQRCEQEKDKFELKEKINRKLGSAEEKREAKLCGIRERIRKHQRHVGEVLQANGKIKFSRETEEKLLEKMEASQSQRERQLTMLVKRLQQHELRGQRVRENKLNQSTSCESFVESASTCSDGGFDDSLLSDMDTSLSALSC